MKPCDPDSDLWRSGGNVVKASWKIVSVKDNEQREIVIFDCDILAGENKQRLVGCRSF